MDHTSEITKLGHSELAQRFSDSLSLTKPSGISQADGMACVALMKQTKDRYIKQQIPETTQEMYLAEWEEMVLRYGLQAFRDALSKAIRDRERAPFFPEPQEIEGYLLAARKAQVEAERSRKVVGEVEEWETTWRRERDEDLAAGVQRGTAQAEMNALLRAVGSSAEPKQGRVVDLTDKLKQVAELKAKLMQQKGR